MPAETQVSCRGEVMNMDGGGVVIRAQTAGPTQVHWPGCADSEGGLL